MFAAVWAELAATYASLARVLFDARMNGSLENEDPVCVTLEHADGVVSMVGGTGADFRPSWQSSVALPTMQSGCGYVDAAPTENVDRRVDPQCQRPAVSSATG